VKKILLAALMLVSAVGLAQIYEVTNGFVHPSTGGSGFFQITCQKTKVNNNWVTNTVVTSHYFSVYPPADPSLTNGVLLRHSITNVSGVKQFLLKFNIAANKRHQLQIAPYLGAPWFVAQEVPAQGFTNEFTFKTAFVNKTAFFRVMRN
jgi:hypothetical protein